ncbi:ABC transporter permease [Nocardioides sp. Bht2]|uniref:ABC transporter permease n=1 Tax=Nocardioides sp. Bht2 TaxID=3392297 RepID=UPI0039B4C0A9
MSERQPPPRAAGVIHDIGYRCYSGPRESNAKIALSLYLTGLRHAFGIGRSGRSKVLPIVLGAFTLLPAVILIGVLAVTGASEALVSYADYTNQVQVLISIFAAAQAPVLFSRDLRSRSIVLYLARPLSPAVLAVVRWASLATACLIFILIPQLLLLGGGLIADLDVSHELSQFLKSVPLTFLLAVMLAGITGLIASYALRRGFAVVGSILALVVLSSGVSIVQAIADETGSRRVGEFAGLFSPWSLVNGLASAMDAGVRVITPPHGAPMVALYLIAIAAVVLGTLTLLVVRFRKAGR